MIPVRFDGFSAILRLEKFEIHRVFLRFSNLDLTRNLSPNLLAELRGAAVSPEGRPAELRGAAIEAGRAGTRGVFPLSRGHVPECYINPALLQSDYKPSRALDLWEGLNYDTGR